MMPKSNSQLSFFAVPANAPTPAHQDVHCPQLALTLTEWEWLDFLADDWWPLKGHSSVVSLGVKSALVSETNDRSSRVIAWIQLERLPDIEVSVQRNGGWERLQLRQVNDSDGEVIWPGPIPLFAIERFSVASEGERERLLALAKSFSNVSEVPTSIEVRATVIGPCASMAPQEQPRFRPPIDWNAYRGAAAMAAWAVPGIRPWIRLFCGMLSSKYEQSLLTDLQALWLAEPPWRSESRKAGGQPVPLLWRAIIEEFRRVRIREEWRPLEILDRISKRVGDKQNADTGIRRLYDETVDLLSDRKRIDVRRGDKDPLGLALQLVLLRPTPEKFITWNDEIATGRPIVWWTGAMLSGMLQGFRDLDTKFKGTPEGRRVLALRTWCIGNDQMDTAYEWPVNTTGDVEWELAQGKFRFRYEGAIWGERAESVRGRWFEAPLDDENVRGAAAQLVKLQAPNLLKTAIYLDDVEIPVCGKGTVKANERKKSLLVKGGVSFLMPADARIEMEIVDESEFRNWVASGAIVSRLPEPPVSQIKELPINRAFNLPSAKMSVSDIPVPGLIVRQDFITEEEEKALIEAIDSSFWLSELKRRVQHYGWRYDYKARRIDPDSYLGPLPEWAEELGQRLLNEELVEERPDQVIVNEYVGKQGISKHIDCLPCFRGAIVTISLCESWEMNFLGPKGERLPTMLNRRSAAIMSGECRTSWKHEIAARLKEPWGNRGRRISLTFRKVDFGMAS